VERRRAPAPGAGIGRMAPAAIQPGACGDLNPWPNALPSSTLKPPA
jgi:hypothetical protein